MLKITLKWFFATCLLSSSTLIFELKMMKPILGVFFNFPFPLKCYFAHLLSLKAHININS